MLNWQASYRDKALTLWSSLAGTAFETISNSVSVGPDGIPPLKPMVEMLNACYVLRGQEGWVLAQLFSRKQQNREKWMDYCDASEKLSSTPDVMIRVTQRRSKRLCRQSSLLGYEIHSLMRMSRCGVKANKSLSH